MRGTPPAQIFGTTLTGFLLARIAEDEAAARSGSGEPVYPHFGDTAAEESVEMALNEGCADGGAEHLRRWLPARVLAECEAKRRIVERHAYINDGSGPLPDGSPLYGQHHALGWVVRDLAAIYAAHDDYREEWRP